MKRRALCIVGALALTALVVGVRFALPYTYAVAATSGQVSVIKWAARFGLDPDVFPREGARALPMAVMVSAPPEVIRALIEAGANPNGMDGDIMSPAAFAVQTPRPLEMLALLHGLGADFTDHGGILGVTALHMAAMTEERYFLVPILIHEYGVPVDTPDDVGQSALTNVSGLGRPAIVRLLLEEGADPNHAARGLTPGVFAAYEGNVEVLELLYAAGMELNPDPTVTVAPLAIAGRANNEAAVEWLLANGADPTHPAEDGISVRDYLQQHEHLHGTRSLELVEEAWQQAQRESTEP